LPEFELPHSTGDRSAAAADERPSRPWPQAVVVGLEINGLALTRALNRRGVSCIAVTQPGWSPTFTSRSIAQLYCCAEWQKDSLIETLLHLGRRLDEPAVLLLTKDESVLWVADAAQELAEYYRFALPDRATVQLLMNKAQFYARALKDGWPVPRGYMVESEAELLKVLPDVPLPAILKPQLRNSDYRRADIPKAFRVATREDLLAAYRRVAVYEREAIVSEWIEGRDTTLYSCRGFWDRDGKPVVQHAARKLMQWPVETGNMAALEIPRPEDWVEPLAIANRVFGSVKMFGVGAMEYKRHRDGRFLILEPCVARTVYSHEIGPLNGYDIPWAAYQYLAFDQRLSPQPPPAGGTIRLIDVPRARQAEHEYLRRGLFTPEEIHDVFARPYLDMTYRREDPLPSLLFQCNAALRKMAAIPVMNWVRNLVRGRRAPVRKAAAEI
jgi:predicted ATP-grasp superfamily ATP-dependent carboligase